MRRQSTKNIVFSIRFVILFLAFLLCNIICMYKSVNALTSRDYKTGGLLCDPDNNCDMSKLIEQDNLFRRSEFAPPTDSGDECYMWHDLCYNYCYKRIFKHQAECIRNCDKHLVKELHDLDDNPARWRRPPRDGTEKDSREFRDWMILKFESN